MCHGAGIIVRLPQMWLASLPLQYWTLYGGIKSLQVEDNTWRLVELAMLLNGPRQFRHRKRYEDMRLSW